MENCTLLLYKKQKGSQKCRYIFKARFAYISHGVLIILHAEVEMYSSVAFLCTAMLLFLGVSCHDFSQAGFVTTSRVHKRQNPELNQCAFDRFNNFYQGNTSRLVADCRSIFTSGFDLSTASQSTINTFYRTLCIPECGNVFLDSYAACGNDFQRNTLVSLCSSNENGNLCYELFVDNVALNNRAVSCSTNPDGCDCLQLSEGARRQGCCINILHDVAKSTGRFTQLENVYSDCNVGLPGMRCNNSRLRSSSPLPAASIVTVLVALFIQTMVYF